MKLYVKAMAEANRILTVFRRIQPDCGISMEKHPTLSLGWRWVDHSPTDGCLATGGNGVTEPESEVWGARTDDAASAAAESQEAVGYRAPGPKPLRCEPARSADASVSIRPIRGTDDCKYCGHPRFSHTREAGACDWQWDAICKGCGCAAFVEPAPRAPEARDEKARRPLGNGSETTTGGSERLPGDEQHTTAGAPEPQPDPDWIAGVDKARGVEPVQVQWPPPRAPEAREPHPRTCVCGHVHPEATDEHNGECEAPGCPCGASSHAPLDVWQQVNCTPCRHWVGGRCAQRRLLTGAEGCPGFAERPREAREPACGIPLDVHPPLHARHRWEHGRRVCREVPDPRTWEPEPAPAEGVSRSPSDASAPAVSVSVSPESPGFALAASPASGSTEREP